MVYREESPRFFFPIYTPYITNIYIYVVESAIYLFVVTFFYAYGVKYSVPLIFYHANAQKILN